MQPIRRRQNPREIRSDLLSSSWLPHHPLTSPHGLSPADSGALGHRTSLNTFTDARMAHRPEKAAQKQSVPAMKLSSLQAFPTHPCEKGVGGQVNKPCLPCFRTPQRSLVQASIFSAHHASRASSRVWCAADKHPFQSLLLRGVGKVTAGRRIFGVSGLRWLHVRHSLEAIIAEARAFLVW